MLIHSPYHSVACKLTFDQHEEGATTFREFTRMEDALVVQPYLAARSAGIVLSSYVPPACEGVTLLKPVTIFCTPCMSEMEYQRTGGHECAHVGMVACGYRDHTEGDAQLTGPAIQLSRDHVRKTVAEVGFDLPRLAEIWPWMYPSDIAKRVAIVTGASLVLHYGACVHVVANDNAYEQNVWMQLRDNVIYQSVRTSRLPVRLRDGAAGAMFIDPGRADGVAVFLPREDGHDPTVGKRHIYLLHENA